MKLSNLRKTSSKNIKENLIRLWQIIIFTSVSTLLTLILIDNGWRKISKNDISISGNSYISKGQIINKINPYLPLRLLAINPKEFEMILLSQLPLKAVKVNRRILPSEVQIDILERKPVAFATKSGPKGKENGMIDSDGYWIEINDLSKSNSSLDEEISVHGWMQSHQKQIAYIYKSRNNVGSKLKKIFISRSGDISIQTEDFKLIHLGNNQNMIRKQIQTLSYLIDSLPAKFTNDPNTIIDIKDPEKPKLLSP